ncbi:MAG: RNA polymerase sigma factor [Baekduia sp.]
MATLAAPGISATARSRPDVTDHDLVQAVRAGDDHAFERLYHRYHRRISAYIFGMVHDHGRAEDLTQEVFVSALRRMRQTDRPIVFKPWVYEIAKNACIDAFRRSKRAEEVSIDAEESLAPADHGKLASNSPSPDAAVEGKQQLDDLCGAFGGLSDAHHQILVMRELEGLSYREIGERLDMSRPSVESTLFRARRRLTEEYEDLRTGARCLRIQEIIEHAGATATALGTRDQRRVGSHISHCQPCRKHAVMAGMDAAALGRRTVRSKLAAFLPLPAILRKRWFGGDGAGDVAAAHAVHHGPALAQVSMAAAQYGEPSMAGWMKATAVVTAVAIAGLGAGAADHAVKSGTSKDAPAVHAAPASAAKAPAATGPAPGGARPTIARSTGTTGAGHGSSGSRRSGTGGSSGAAGFSGGGGAAGTNSAGSSGGGAPSTSNGGAGKGECASTASAGGSGTTSTKQKPAGGGASGAVQQAAGAVSGAAGTATDTATGATGGGSTAPLVDPNLGALTQPSGNPPPETAGQVVSGATDVVGNTVGGQAGDVVKQTGAAVGSTVDNVTQGVTGAVGGLLGGK